MRDSAGIQHHTFHIPSNGKDDDVHVLVFDVVAPRCGATAGGVDNGEGPPETARTTTASQDTTAAKQAVQDLAVHKGQKAWRDTGRERGDRRSSAFIDNDNDTLR